MSQLVMEQSFLNEKFQDLYLRTGVESRGRLCPECHSLLSDDKLCPDCGRILKIDRIGEPFGPRSYYSIRERYFESLPWYLKLYPFLENRDSQRSLKYKQELLYRLKCFSDSKEISPLLKTEVIQLIEELLLYEKDLVKLSDHISRITAVDLTYLLIGIQSRESHREPLRAIERLLTPFRRLVILSLLASLTLVLLLANGPIFYKSIISSFGR